MRHTDPKSLTGVIAPTTDSSGLHVRGRTSGSTQQVTFQEALEDSREIGRDGVVAITEPRAALESLIYDGTPRHLGADFVAKLAVRLFPDRPLDADPTVEGGQGDCRGKGVSGLIGPGVSGPERSHDD
ncbi:hypothetical protein OSH93_22860, partial [Mycobacterium ulcerans]|nr:hypothetical protein [Mycobacterium ulcerans]